MKFYCVSDIHGYYDILRDTLKKYGFKENDPSNMLICCGDYWDRGNQPYEVMKYLMSLNNVILIRGNHEDLMVDYINRGYAERHDISNGTEKTFWNLCGKFKHNDKKALLPQFRDFITPFYDKMLNYYETEHYVFVHGWIPVKHTYFEGESGYTYENKHQYDPDWRGANNVEWEDARWSNGIDEAYKGIIVPGKTVICGHWHCSYGWARKVYEETKDYAKYKQLIDFPRWDPFEMDGIIAIDRCTALTNEMNILILEDEVLEKA